VADARSTRSAYRDSHDALLRALGGTASA
jgi:hypothetical protein